MFQCCSSAAEEARKEIYVQKFLHIAGLLNEQLLTTPLLYGSLGLERRLSADLNADDIDLEHYGHYTKKGGPVGDRSSFAFHRKAAITS